MELKERLIELRVSRNLPKPRLAESIGVTVQEITAWENGSAVPSKEQLKALEQYYRQPLMAKPADDEEPEERKGPSLKAVWIATIIWAAAIVGLVVIFFIQEFGG